MAEEDWELDFVEENVLQFQVSYVGMALELLGPTIMHADFYTDAGNLFWYGQVLHHCQHHDQPFCAPSAPTPLLVLCAVFPKTVK